MLNRFGQAMMVLSFLGAKPASADCGAVDFLSLALPDVVKHPIGTALELAYFGLDVSDDGKIVRLEDGTTLKIGLDGNRTPQLRLVEATIAEQFHDRYPLQFDLEARKKPYFDPGRARNDAFFKALYFPNKSSARASLRLIRGPEPLGAKFYMTLRRNVACQLAKALEEIAKTRYVNNPIFQNVGGSFSWRKISGTNRLSAHSFGIAFDVNAQLGGYWRWSGEVEGQVEEYDNNLPAEVVGIFERYGFIWGGKWHHYDGMHFEYRPELILYARIVVR